MRYPQVVNYVTFEDAGNGRTRVRDRCYEKSYIMSKESADFLMQLDGKANPYGVTSPLGKEARKELLSIFEKHRITRNSRVYSPSLLCVEYALLYISKSEKWKNCAHLLNLILLCLWFPVFSLGIFQFVMCLPMFSERGLYLGTIVGMLLGIVLHECAHTVACIGYGGSAFEVGLFWQWVFPGAYVLMDMSQVKKGLHRAQVYAAGAQMNFLLCGIMLFLTVYVYPISGFCFAGAISNFILAVLNLMFFEIDMKNGGSLSLDGMGIIRELIAIDELKKVQGMLVPHTAFRAASLCALVSVAAIMLANVLEVVLCWL